MRLPRLTTRRLMLAATVVALILTVHSLQSRRAYRLKRAEFRTRQEALLRSGLTVAEQEIAAELKTAEEWTRLVPSFDDPEESRLASEDVRLARSQASIDEKIPSEDRR